MRDLITIIEALEQGCPPATQDITLNLKNRQKAIDEYHYGPLNPNEPNDEYWAELADKWNTDDIESVKENRCGNCAAFDMSEDMLDCIAKGIGSEPRSNPMDTIDAGQLGYCKFLKFKCAAKRTCDAWVEGGPITEDTVTFDHLTNKKLRRILVSGPKNLDEVVWAMDFTDDALRADYDDEGIDSRTFDARNNAFNQASAAFHDEDGEFNPDADIDATLAHLKQFWSV